MRVLHFAQNVAGGISSYFDEIAPYQIERYGSDNVMFLVPGQDQTNLSRVPGGCVATFHDTERTPSSLFRLALHSRKVVETFKPDIVHLHSTFAGLVFRSIMPLLRDKPKIVYCAHGWSFGREQSTAKARIFARIERLLMMFTDVCINISGHEARLAKSFGIPMDNCVTVPNGIAREPVRSAPASDGKPAEKLRLLFVGRHDPQKGLDILLDAMRAIPPERCHLDVVGAPVVSKSPVDRGDLPANVSILGALPRAEVNELMRRCDALVVPSRWEGFGLVVIEAMRAGKPAIVSPSGALPDLVEHGRTGIILGELSPKGIADTLAALSGGALADMGPRARVVFEERYTSDAMNAAIDSIYDRLLETERVERPEPVARQSLPKRSRV